MRPIQNTGEFYQARPPGNVWRNLWHSRRAWTIVAVGLAVAVVGLSAANLVKYDVVVVGGSGEAAAPPTISSEPSESGEGGESVGPDLAALTGLGEASGGAWVAAGHKDFRFELTGVVPTEFEKTSIERVAAGIYGSLGETSLTVDPEVGDAEWAGNPAQGVENLLFVAAYRTLSAEFVVTDSGVLANGVAPAGALLDEVYADAISGAAEADPTLGPVSGTFETVELRTPTVNAKFENGNLTLTGELPTRAFADDLVKDAKVLFGDDAVTDQFEIAPDTFAFVPLRNFHVVLASFKPFRTFEITIENETFAGEIIYGIDFDPGSKTLDEATKASLDELLRFMNIAKLPVKISGYTDADGDALVNAELSAERAKAVKQYFVDRGVIDPDRIVTEGRGAEQPIADNSTEEGRETNRRVEISIVQGTAV